MASLKSIGALTLLFPLVWACGSPLAGASYRGVPVYTLRGQVYGTSVDVSLNEPTVRIALFWSPSGLGDEGIDDFVEQTNTGVDAQVPLGFVMNIFSNPPASALTGGSGSWGIGRVLAYVDANNNGRRDSGESIVGADGSHAVVYAPQDLGPRQSPTSEYLPAGYHLVSLPLDCGGPPPQPPGDSDCGVPLGDACKSNQDCNGGVCLLQFLMPWPGGACAIRSPPPDGCMPSGRLVPGPSGQGAYFIRACHQDSDCGRGFPYVCDLQSYTCLPSGMMVVQIADDLGYAPLCGQPPDGGSGDGGGAPMPDGG